MTVEQRQRVRKVNDKLCVKAAKYKGVDEKACANCESPCAYGVEMLAALGMDAPRRWKERDGGAGASVIPSRSTRRIMRSINKGRGK